MFHSCEENPNVYINQKNTWKKCDDANENHNVNFISRFLNIVRGFHPEKGDKV